MRLTVSVRVDEANVNEPLRAVIDLAEPVLSVDSIYEFRARRQYFLYCGHRHALSLRGPLVVASLLCGCPSVPAAVSGKASQEVDIHLGHLRDIADGRVTSEDLVRWIRLDALAWYAVHRYSGGIPRLINMLCDRALLGGYSTETSRIDDHLVAAAAEGLDLKTAAPAGGSWLDRLRGRQFA